ATPTKEQINQFKKLPKAQQEALARQLGVASGVLDEFTGVEQLDEAQPAPLLEPTIESRESSFIQRVQPSPMQPSNGLKKFGYDALRRDVLRDEVSDFTVV
ncbi:hypothetical protein CBF23_015270, partial [Marinomonas agarivorans]